MERVSFYDQIQRNKIKSVLLIGIIFVFFVVLGYIISFAFDPGYFYFIMIIAIIFSLGYTWIGYYNSDKIALASVGAVAVTRSQQRQFFDSVEGLSLASGLPMPRLYVMKGEQINAFASGRDPQHAVICVTEGALNKLNKQELEGVLAHELSHIANFDIRFMTLVTVLVGMIAIISQIFLRSLSFRGGNDNERRNAILMLIGFVLAILAPIVVNLVQLAVSRKREFVADANGVKFTRYPPGLIGALKKIKGDKPMEINKAVAPLFLSDPWKRRIEGWFSTHPPIDKRIEILGRM